MRRAAAISLAAAALFGVTAASASAAPANVGTTILFTFTAPSYDHEAGTVAKLTYASLFAPHNAVSTQTQPNGENLFDSATISAGQTDINGTQYLPAGDYPFICTIHPFMVSSLKVAGTPLPRPVRGPPTPPPAPGASQTPDGAVAKKTCGKKKGKARKRCLRKRR